MLRATVIVFPGSNCDRDVKVALEAVTGFPVKMVWHGDASVPGSDLIVLPGGFSYGDYLRCGAMAAHSPIMRDVIAKAKAGTPVLGICNGFQMLCETGLLPGILMRNASLKFVCRDVTLKCENNSTVFTNCYRRGEVMRLPVAHGDGNYFADAETLARLEGEGRVVFRYCDADGNATPDSNPNGAQNNIAGIVDETGRILGMMPHPERLFERALGGTDGRRIFESVLVGVAELMSGGDAGAAEPSAGPMSPQIASLMYGNRQ
jgi:phosphoribosylformylglycinamidine synthase